MLKDFDLKSLIKQIEKEIDNNPLLNVPLSNIDVMQIGTKSNNLFFENLGLNKEFIFRNFCEKEEANKKQDISTVLNKWKNQINALDLITDLNSIDQENYLFNCIDNNNVYISFVNLYYKRKNSNNICCSPLLFIKVNIQKKDLKYTLKLDYNYIIENKILTRLLQQEYKVDLSYELMNFNYEKFLDDTKRKVEPLMFAIDETIQIVNYDIMQDLYKLSLLEQNEQNYLSNNIFKFLKGESINNKQEFFSKSDEFHFVQKGLNELASNDIIAIHMDTSLEKDFLYRTINEYVSKKETVLIVSSSKAEKDDTHSKLTSHYFDKFVGMKSIFDPSTSLFNLLKLIPNKQSNINSSALIRKQEILDMQQENRINNLKIKEFSNIEKEKDDVISKMYYETKKHATQTYTFAQDKHYYESNYLIDKEFIDYVKDDYFNKNDIKTDIFLNVSSLVFSDQYTLFIKFINEVINDFNRIQEIVNLSHINESGFGNFNNFDEIKKKLYLFDIYLEFFHFDYRYFNIGFTEDIVQKLDLLISAYRTKASIQLSLDLLCDKRIWEYDFADLLQYIVLNKRNKVIDADLKSIIKLKPYKKSYKTLAILLDKYINNENIITQNINNIQDYFNIDLSNEAKNLDILLNVKNIYLYLEKYNDFKLTYKNKFIINSEFEHQIFISNEFFNQFEKNLKLIHPIIEKIKDNLSKLEIVVENDKFDFVNTNFSECVNHLKEYLNGSQQDFTYAIQYKKLLNSTSPFLSEVIESINYKDFANLSNNFYVSFIQHDLMLTFKELGGFKFIEKLSEFEETTNNQYDESLYYLDVDLLRNYDAYRQDVIDQPSFNQTLINLKKETINGPFYQTNRALKLAGDIYFHLKPIQIEYIKDLYVYKARKFDLEIIFYDKTTSVFDLLFALTMAEKVIIIDNSNSFKNHDFYLNDDLNEYNSFYKLPAVTFNKIKAAFKRQGIELKKNYLSKEGFNIPLGFSYNDITYLLSIENQDNIYTTNKALNFPAFLNLQYNIKTVHLYLLFFMIYEDLSVFSLYNKIDISKSLNSISTKQYDELTSEQKKRVDYYMALERIDISFSNYINKDGSTNESNNLKRSLKQYRPIQSIPYEEIANGILTYLKSFTYLSKQTLIDKIADVVDTNRYDIDFLQLFSKAVKYLTDNNLIEEKENRLYFKR